MSNEQSVLPLTYKSHFHECIHPNDVVLRSFYKGVFFVRTLVFGVVDERVVETGLKPVSTHVINYGSPKSVTKTHHEANTPFFL